MVHLLPLTKSVPPNPFEQCLVTHVQTLGAGEPVAEEWAAQRRTLYGDAPRSRLESGSVFRCLAAILFRAVPVWQTVSASIVGELNNLTGQQGAASVRIAQAKCPLLSLRKARGSSQPSRYGMGPFQRQTAAPSTHLKCESRHKFPRKCWDVQAGLGYCVALKASGIRQDLEAEVVKKGPKSKQLGA